MAPEQILAALQKLDVNNDGHWTQDSAPRLETVRLFAGNQTLTRDDITKAAPDFTRLTAYNAQQTVVQETQPGAQKVTAVPPPTDPAPPAATTEPQAPRELLELPSRFPDFKDLSKQERLEFVEDELEDIERCLVGAKKEKAKLQQQRDDLIIQIEKEAPVNSNTHDIQAYLKSQNEQLARRAQQIANVKKVESELGARLSDLVPKRAPIDAAMARRTGYGRNRPSR